jgi:hypothetical protein
LLTDSWTGLTLSVVAGNVLALLVTQEDGTNEMTNIAMELSVTLV